MSRAIITGITGQDAAYLADLLLGKGYTVFGTYRSHGTRNFWRIEELGIKEHPNLHLLEFEATGLQVCVDLLTETGATELYNLAGQSSAVASLAEPLATALANGMSPQYLLEAIRLESPATRFFQASSSELFGQAQQVPQLETTPFNPTSPYGVAKLFAHWATVNYREAYGLFAACGILFNHESPLRGSDFVTRKITTALGGINVGKQQVLELGNMDAKRDWGYAKDYTYGMWSALQASEPDTFLFATNQMHTVREFVTLAGNAAGFNLRWEGSAENEVGIDDNSGRTVVRVNPDLYRPMEIHLRVGNPGKALKKLAWKPTTPLKQLCEMMVEADILRIRRASS